MVDIIRSKPTDRRITHPVSLIKDGVELGLILCDGRGNPDPRAMRQGNNPRTSLQIRQGDADYSDFELPYTPFTQKDFSGGRGSEEFESDKSRYFDSMNLNAVHGRAFLGPKMNAGQFLNAAGAVIPVYGNAHFFEYKGGHYCVTQDKGGIRTPTLSMNGKRGMCKAGSTSSDVITNLDLTGLDLAGKTMLITGGAGLTEERHWRIISGNTQGVVGGDTIQFWTDYWELILDATTEFVILGMDEWYEIAGHGLNKPVTSVLVYGDIVYFAMGEDTNIRRIKWENVAGVWTMTAADDGTNKATFLKLLPRTIGGSRIWKVNNTLNGVPTATYATPQAWGVNLDFATKPSEVTADWPIPLVSGNSIGISKVTGIEGYGDPIIPYILKEDEIGSIENGIYSPVPLSEMRAVKHYTNGAAHMQYGVYLFFSLLNGWERYYSNRLDDIGPNRELGFPAGRKGRIACTIPYPGQVFMSIDAETNGYSSILSWNGVGFHELLRAGMPNVRIRNMTVQTTPDDNEPDRLWFVYGDKLNYIHLAIDPLSQAGYKFTDYGYLQSARINGGFQEINKYWHEFRVFMNRYARNAAYAKMAYRTTNGVSPRNMVELYQAVNFETTIPNAFATLHSAIFTQFVIAASYGASGFIVDSSIDGFHTATQIHIKPESAYKNPLCAAELPGGTAILAVGESLTPTKTRLYKITAPTTATPGTPPTVTLLSSYFDTTNLQVVTKIIALTDTEIYAMSATKLFYSADGGVTWTLIRTANGTLHDFTIETISGGQYIFTFEILNPATDQTEEYSALLPNRTTWTLGPNFGVKDNQRMVRLSDGFYLLIATNSGATLIRTYELGTNPIGSYGLDASPDFHALLPEQFKITDVCATANGGVIIAVTQTSNLAYTGSCRAYWFYSHDHGKTWIPYTADAFVTKTSKMHHLAGEAILFGAQLAGRSFDKAAAVLRSESDSDWIAVDGVCEQPVTELKLSADDNVSGQRLQYMFELYNTNASKTPVLKATTIDAVTRLKGKKSWVLSFLVDDMAVDLQGKRVTWTANEFIAQLNSWADSDLTPTPITMRYNHEIHDNRRVFVEYPTVVPLENTNTEQPHKIKLLCQLVVTEA